jgi:hypothetical protein
MQSHPATARRKRPLTEPHEANSRTLVKIVAGTRRMKFYTIASHELRGLSVSNALTTFFFGMFTMFLGIGIGIITSASFSDPKTIPSTGQVLAGPGLICVFMLATAFALAAVVSFFVVKNNVDTIKSESQNTS